MRSLKFISQRDFEVKPEWVQAVGHKHCFAKKFVKKGDLIAFTSTDDMANDPATDYDEPEFGKYCWATNPEKDLHGNWVTDPKGFFEFLLTCMVPPVPPVPPEPPKSRYDRLAEELEFEDDQGR